MKKGLLVALFTVLNLFVFAQNTTTINGSAGNNGFQEVTVKIVNDFLTNTHETISTIAIAENGDFKVNLAIDKVTYVLLDFGRLKRHFFAEPGKNYKVDLGNINPRVLSQNPTLFDLDEQPINILNADSTELNYLMQKLDAELAQFSLDHLNELLRSRPKDLLNHLNDSLGQKYPLGKSSFFDVYFEYSVASLYQFVYKRGKDMFQAVYFVDKPVHSDNPAYMKLLKMQLEKYLHMEYSKPERKYLLDYINKNQYGELLESIYPLSKQTELNELVLLHAIYENWGNYRINPKSIEFHLSKLIESTTSNTNKLCATNIQRKLMELAPGSEAPDFALYDLDSNLFMLSALKGKYVYLNFTESWSKNFDLDSRVMMSWKNKIPELEVVSVMVDADMDLVTAYLEKEQPNWTILYSGPNPAILLDYKLSTYPIYFLIGPDGKIILSPAKSPYEGFEKQFRSITQ